MVIWTTISLADFGVPWWRFLLAVVALGLASWCFGGVAQVLLGLTAHERRSPFPRLSLGFAATVTVISLLALTRMGALFVGISIGVLTLLCGAFLVRRQVPRLRMPQLPDARDWMMVTVLLRVCTAGSEYVSVGQSTVQVTQYWDLPYHLALVKEGLFRGLPLDQNPLLAGVERSPYHPGFDSFATVLVKTTGLPVDPGFYGVVLPLVGVAFVLALISLTGYATGSRWSPYVALLVLGAFPALKSVLNLVPGLSHSNADIDLIARFAFNPPAATAAVAAAMSVALFARRSETNGRRCLVGAALLAGATVCMKANTAIAFGPALICALAVFAWRRRRPRLFFAPTVSALASGALCYVATRGNGGARIAIDLGAYARWARPGLNNAVALWSRATEKLGTVGDALFLVGHLIGSFLVWRLFPAVLALVRRPRLPSPESERRASAVNSYCLWFLFWTLVIAFTVVQVDVGRFSAWNISDHTVSNITWIGVILAAIGLYRVVRRVLSPRWGIRLAAGALVVIVGLTPLTMRGVAGMRSEPGQVLDAHLYELLLKVPDYTPPQALVAQNFDTKTGAWVSGVSGRSTPLERADTWRAYRPVEEKRRAEAIHALYQAPTTDTAIEAAIDLGADYVIVGPDDPSVLAEAGTELVRSGPWILVRIP